MSDQNQSTPRPRPTPPALPEGWAESAAFRETSLQYFTQPDDADRLRAFGGWLHDRALESATRWPVPPGYGVALQLRAAAADLRFLQGYLTQAGHDRHMSSLAPEEEALAHLAERQAAEVARIAEILEGAVG
jgi:hypothetical protein